MHLRLIAPILLVAIAAKADSIAYEIASTRDLGTVDLNTGVYTEIGKTPNIPVVGLANFGGTLYAAGSDLYPNLYAVNTANGNFNEIGGLGSGNFQLFGATTTGLYALGTIVVGGKLTTVLWSINPSSGASTLIGPTLQGAGAAGVASLSSGSSTLYLDVGTYLYTLSTATGQATLVGNSFPFGSTATVFENGVLYGSANSPTREFFSLNASTAQGTFLSNESNGPQGGFIEALAATSSNSSTVTPEPGSLALLGGALFMVGGLLRRRHKNELAVHRRR